MANADRRASISQMLANVAGILLAGAFTFLVFVLDKRDPGFLFWLCFVIGIAATVLSVMFGGWGMDADSANAYNGQSFACLIGFLFLAASLIFLGPTKPDATAKLIAIIVDRETTIEQMKTSNAVAEGKLNALADEVAKLRREIEKITQRQSGGRQLRRSQPFPPSAKMKRSPRATRQSAPLVSSNAHP